MGLMDKLNNLTQQLNNAADKLTNSNVQQTLPNSQGLGGLGNVYSTHENGVMESPNNSMEKICTDVRKITPYTDKFQDSIQYAEYLRNWFNETGLFNVSANGSCIMLQMGTTVNNQSFIANYNIFACNTHFDVDATLKQLETNPITNGTTVIMGYINFNDSQVNMAKHLGVQLIGIDGIQEINTAIDLADSKLPYVTFDKTLFLHVLSDALHNKYKMQQPVNSGNTFDNMANQVSSSLNNFSDRATEAVNGLVAGVGLSKEPTNNTSVNNGNQQIVKDEEQLAKELADNTEVKDMQQCSCVSLEKNSGISLGKESDTVDSKNEAPEENIGVSLGKKSGVSLGK